MLLVLTVFSSHLLFSDAALRSSRTFLHLEDSSTTKYHGLGLYTLVTVPCNLCAQSNEFHGILCDVHGV